MRRKVLHIGTNERRIFNDEEGSKEKVITYVEGHIKIEKYQSWKLNESLSKKGTTGQQR